MATVGEKFGRYVHRSPKCGACSPLRGSKGRISAAAGSSRGRPRGRCRFVPVDPTSQGAMTGRRPSTGSGYRVASRVNQLLDRATQTRDMCGRQRPMRSFPPSPAPIDLARVRRVLVVKLSSFGDVVHVTPCLRAIRRSCPGAEILVAVDSTWAALLRDDPHIDGVIAADPRRRRFLASWIDAKRLLARQPGPPFDLAIDFQGLPRSAAWIYASGARWRTGRGRLRPAWDLTVTPDLERHAVHVCAEVAERVGIPVADLEPRLFLSEAADQAIQGALAAVGAPRAGFVLVNPFGTWRAKIWPDERWAALIRRMQAEVGLPAVVAGGPGEERDAQRLLARLAPSPPPSLVGKTSLAEALCLYRRAALVVSGDSGPAHAAAAVGTPVVALFGATWPERTGPWGGSHRVIQASRAPSHDAYRDDGARRHIEAIDVETVLDAVAALYQCRADRHRSAAGAVRPARIS